MDNKLVIQLLKNKAEEIQNLLEHFLNNSSDLDDGLELLESRIDGLTRDFEILKKNFIASCSNKIVIDLPKENQISESEPIKKEVCLPKSIQDEKELVVEPTNNKLNVDKSEQEESPILNERLQSDPVKIVSEKLSSKKLVDIQSAIGINDRFLFTRELFGNNTNEYNSAISFINQSENFDSVLNWIKAEKEWNMEDPTVVQFIEITKRKF